LGFGVVAVAAFFAVSAGEAGGAAVDPFGEARGRPVCGRGRIRGGVLVDRVHGALPSIPARLIPHDFGRVARGVDA